MEITYRLDDGDIGLMRQNRVKVIAELEIERPEVLSLGEAVVQSLMDDLGAAVQRGAEVVQRTSLERWAERHRDLFLMRWPGNPVDDIKGHLPEEIQGLAVDAYVVVAIRPAPEPETSKLVMPR